MEDVNIETKNLEIIYRENPSLSCKTIITSEPNSSVQHKRHEFQPVIAKCIRPLEGLKTAKSLKPEDIFIDCLTSKPDILRGNSPTWFK